jgi:hypothetical protein
MGRQPFCDAFARKRRLRVERLEDRRMLAVFTVDNLDDLPVDSAGDAPGSLRQAIFDANALAGADTIVFDSELTESGPVTLELLHDDLIITSNLTITGPGADLLTIDASQSAATHVEGSRVFDVNDNNSNLVDVFISGLTLTGANVEHPGGAIRSHENLTLTNSVITGNDSDRGAGLYNRFGTMKVINSTVSHNLGPETGGLGAGITNWEGTLIVTDSTINDNGFVLCSICGTYKGGGGIFNHKGSATITGSSIFHNSGGGIYSSGLDGPADVTIVGSSINDNVFGFLGARGLSLNKSLSSIADSFINDNEDGGIFNRLESLTIAGSTISGNDATNGAGIYNLAANLTISETTISGNTATADGGGLHHAEGDLTVTASTISGNSALEGGGLRVRTSPYTTEAMRITNTTVSGNTAAVGAGLWVRSFTGDTFDLAHSTVTTNTVDVFGGGIYFFASTGVDTIDHSIVAGNVRDDGGRDDIDGDVEARFSLVGDDTNATIIDNGGNLIGTGVDPIDPQLAPLADNGGPTLTHRLLFISSAIDAGDEDFVAPPAFDQRGDPFARVFDGDGDSIDRIDMGAFESEAVVFLVDTLDDESDGDYGEGDFSLREAIELSNASATLETIGFDSALDGGTITLSLLLGELEVTSSVIIETTGLADGLTVDAAGSDITPGVIDGFGTRVFVVDDGDDGALIEVTISGLTIMGADYANEGGAIFNDEVLKVVGSTITGNAAQWGGGIYNAEFGDLTVTGSTISGNTATATGSGGGVYNFGGTASISQSTITQNFAPDGGGIKNVNSGDLSVLGSTVHDNSASGSGGGIVNDGSTLIVEDSTITGNDANLGAGIYNASGETNITRSTISGNVAGSSGGGVLNGFGQLVVTDSTLSGNSAGYGGGIYIGGQNSFDTTITNTTISSNTASLGGGGMYNFQGNVFLAHSTITDNEAPTGEGSGVYTWADPLTALTTVYSSIVAGNVHSDVDGATGLGVTSFVSDGYNLVGVGAAQNAFDDPSDQVGELDPGLGPLQDNGGPTFTHGLLPGSPAIDAGDPGFVLPPDFDQRGTGFDRVRDGDGTAGPRIDIGALEAQSIPTPELLGDYNLNDVVDAADYVVWRKTLGTGGIAAFSGADGSGNGLIDQADHNVWRANFGNVPPPGAGNGTSVERGMGNEEGNTSVTEPVAAERAADAAAGLRGIAKWETFGQRTVRGEETHALLRRETRAQRLASGRDDALLAWLALRMDGEHELAVDRASGREVGAHNATDDLFAELDVSFDALAYVFE